MSHPTIQLLLHPGSSSTEFVIDEYLSSWVFARFRMADLHGRIVAQHSNGLEKGIACSIFYASARSDGIHIDRLLIDGKMAWNGRFSISR